MRWRGAPDSLSVRAADHAGYRVCDEFFHRGAAEYQQVDGVGMPGRAIGLD